MQIVYLSALSPNNPRYLTLSSTTLTKYAVLRLDTAYLDTVHHDRGLRVIVVGWYFGDRNCNIVTRRDLSKNRVLGWPWAEPVEVAIVRNIQEELRATCVGFAAVGHGKSAWCVGVPPC